MGNRSSKTQVATTPVKANINSKIRANDDLTIDPNVLMDPRSPDIHRTPLTDVLGNRLNYLDKIELLPYTPINLLRSKLDGSLNDQKFLDPRSPSQFIPRTPLNLSFDDTRSLDGNTALYSIEYNGNIEDESCRNFYERLANITFDDAETEASNAFKSQKVTLHEIHEEDPLGIISISEQEIQNLSAMASETIQQETPIEKIPIVSELKFTDDLGTDGKIFSPIRNNTVLTNKNSNATSAFSSTPIIANNGRLKKILLASHLKEANKTEIFEDDEVDDCTSDNFLDGNRSEDEILSTPAKRFNINDENASRTPLSVLNRRSKSFETLSQRHSKLNQTKENERVIGSRSKLNDENIYFTPKPKSNGLRQRNVEIRSRVVILND